MQYELGKEAIKSGASYVNEQFDKVNYGTLKTYFDVDNQYLWRKLLLIFLPFKIGKYSQSAGGALYSPDLYIPTMALVTLVLMKGFQLGIKCTFSPDLMLLAFSRILSFHFLLCIFYKAVGYILGSNIGFIDLVAVTGYKFVIATIVWPATRIYLGVLFSVYFLVAFFFFESRSLKKIMDVNIGSKHQIYFLFGIVCMDVFSIILIIR